MMPDEDVCHLLTYLYGGTDGLAEARRVDNKIDTLPGLAEVHLVELGADPAKFFTEPDYDGYPEITRTEESELPTEPGAATPRSR